MKELTRDIEQLYEAGQQLRKLTTTGARLALFLMDNLAELLMFRTVLHHFEWDKRWHRPPKYTTQKRDKVMGYFNEKVNFLTNETKELSYTESNILKLGHRLRNEAYHHGILRELIIVQIVSVCYEVVCNIHPRMWVGHYTIPQDNSEIPSFFKRYGLEVKNWLIDKTVLARLSDVFLKDIRVPVSELAEVLSTDLEERLEQTLEGLEYIANKPRTAEDVLKHIQFYVKFWSEHSYPQTNEGARQSFEDWEREYKTYSPPVTVKTLQQWKQSATELKTEVNLALLVQKFDQFDQEFFPLEEQVTEAVVAYEMSMDL